MAEQDRKKTAIKAPLSWAFDKAIENWPAIVGFFVGPGAMAYLASISAFLQPFGPVAWGAAALCTLAVMTLMYLAYGIARKKVATANILALRASAKSSNVLAPSHEHESLNLVDFFHPLATKVSRVRFAHCHLFGPINVAWQGTTFNRCSFGHCEVVIVKPGLTTTVLLLEDCEFSECNLFSLTIFLTKEQWLTLPHNLRTGMQVLNDGV
ncbi:two transmembrane segments containing protein [Variovorax phage VarioGold]|uniref:hypothetical protein n=1 Tax=Variovorax sp. ZS18.2.2 TaxID=2971255 RepID=UPI0021514A38|nr:hypothetical protein [Variovorax sp. ZS18.2.2]MCR6477510.1 hypothetical protein [Variovorax sp. ZS18.2.2]UYD72076.1 two transmembrane segments containing protein [Variovorax phage VarioGold]